MSAPRSAALVGGLVAIALFAGSLRAELVDEELRAQWEQWEQDPLDLALASLDELVLLPGSDTAIASAVIELRERGRLVDLDALELVTALDPTSRSRWRELVRIGPPPETRAAEVVGSAAPASLRVRSQLDGDDRRAPSGRLRVEVLREDVEVMVVRRSPESDSRFAAMGAVGRLHWGFGHLRWVGGDGAALPSSGARSRTAPTRRPRAVTVRPGTGFAADVALARVALGWVEPHTSGWVRFEPSRRAIDAALSRDDGGRAWGASWMGGAGDPNGSLWMRWGGARGPQAWGVVAPGPGGAATHVGVGHAGGGWRVGIALTRARSFATEGVDPITGASLDRFHVARQVEVALGERAWALEILLRDVERGRPGAIEGRERLRTRWRWTPPARDPSSRWQLTLETNLDEPRRAEVEPVDDALSIGSAEVTWRATVERRGRGWTARAVVRRAGPPGRREEAVSVVLRGAGPGAPTFAGVAAGGQRSSPWSVHRPSAGSLPLWIEPGGLALGVSLQSRGRRSSAWGVWGWWRGTPRGGSDLGIGVSLDRLWRSGSRAAVAPLPP